MTRITFVAAQGAGQWGAAAGGAQAQGFGGQAQWGQQQQQYGGAQVFELVRKQSFIAFPFHAHARLSFKTKRVTHMMYEML